jgi:hypothetical protein
MGGLRRILVMAAVALASAGATTARADSPAAAARDVIVVDVDAGSSGVDGARLRKAIGYELGADAIEPDDARAGKARGTIEVRIESDAATLVVSYREKGAPIVRRMDLPATADATMRAAVLLAGNLARDEASELAGMLRKRAPAPKRASGELQTDELIEPEQAAPAVDPHAERDLALAKGTIGFYAHHNRGLKAALGWTLFGAAVGASGTGVYLMVEQRRTDFVLPLLGVGAGVSIAAIPLFPNGRLDLLERYYERDAATGRPPQLVRDDLEAQWLASARTERKWRRVLAWTEGILFAAGAALSAPAIVSSPTNVEYWLAPFYLTGVTAPALAINIGPGPIEASLHAYERSTGRAIWREGAPRIEPAVAPTLGGGTVGLSGRF